MGIVNILGAGYGKTFDITKVKFKKIIFLTDADADGAHIASLLLLLFLKTLRCRAFGGIPLNNN